MKNRIADLKIGSSGDIIVGIPSGRAGYMFRPVLGRLREKYPASQLFFKEGGTSDLLELLQMGKVSFIIVPYFDDELPVGIHKEHIYDEEIPLIAAPDFFSDADFWDKGARRINFNKIAKKPFIAVKKDTSSAPLWTASSKKKASFPIFSRKLTAATMPSSLQPAGWATPLCPSARSSSSGTNKMGQVFPTVTIHPSFPSKPFIKKERILIKQRNI